MERVHVLVEGQTEEAFVGRVLQPHLFELGVHLTPILVVTKRVIAGPNHKGGLSRWEPVRRDIVRLLGDSSAIAVTTMLDYYGLPGDWPGADDRPSNDARAAVAHLETATDAAVGSGRFSAFLALHEFESMLYVDPVAAGQYLGSQVLTKAMEAAISSCGEPELVNDDPATAPSKRILAAFPGYQKVFHGPVVAERIGLDELRAGCPHFGEWVEWLESFGS